jgi:pimeloyl-ACP methyl ester carboxylesterase
MCSFLVLLLLLATAAAPAGASRPVILLHGIGDNSIGFPLVTTSIYGFKEAIEKALPGGASCVIPFRRTIWLLTRLCPDCAVYVKSLYVGSILDDEREGFFGRVSDQLRDVCKNELANDARLTDSAADGINAIGFSQGGLLMRALIQTCEAVNVKVFLSVGSPQGGVSALPECKCVCRPHACAAVDRCEAHALKTAARTYDDPAVSLLCLGMQDWLHGGMYTPLAQNNVVPVQVRRRARDSPRNVTPD